jgi:hypothetical protein
MAVVRNLSPANLLHNERSGEKTCLAGGHNILYGVKEIKKQPETQKRLKSNSENDDKK